MKTPYEIETIIAQMGGPMIFKMAFKSCAYATSPNPAVTFLVAPSLKKSAKCSHVRVTLEPSDTYKVEFINVRGTDVKTVYETDSIYNDQLKGLVEEKTGLYLSL